MKVQFHYLDKRIFYTQQLVSNYKAIATKTVLRSVGASPDKMQAIHSSKVVQQSQRDTKSLRNKDKSVPQDY